MSDDEEEFGFLQHEQVFKYVSCDACGGVVKAEDRKTCIECEAKLCGNCSGAFITENGTLICMECYKESFAPPPDEPTPECRIGDLVKIIKSPSVYEGRVAEVTSIVDLAGTICINVKMPREDPYTDGVRPIELTLLMKDIKLVRSKDEVLET